MTYNPSTGLVNQIAEGAGGSAGVSVSDNFNRANSTDLGSAWSEGSLYTGSVLTDFSIAANQVTVTPGWSAAVHTTPAAGDTQYAEMTVHNVANAEYVGPAVRMASNGTQGYVVVARAGTNEVRLYRIASGLIFLDSQSLPTSPEGKTLRLEASGSTLTVKVDGASVLTFTDSTYLGAANRNVGLVSNGAEGDNFAGGDVGALPPAGNPAWVVGVNRDTAGRASTLTYPGGGTRTLTYSPDGRQASDTVRNQASAVTASVAYEYNCVGELDYETVTLPGNAGTGTNAYRYDAAGRLVRWDPGAATAPEQCPPLTGPAAVTGVGDNFNRVNSTALGTAWTEQVPTSGAAATALTIAGNELTNLGTTWLAALHTTVATTDRQAAEVKVKNLSTVV